MGRIRSVKPELRTDLTVAEWPIPVRYAWVLLWGYLDDDGRGLDDTRLLAADLFPLDDAMTARKVETVVATWAKSGRVCRYTVDGRAYLHAVNWARHQKINRPFPSRLPPCPIHDLSSEPLTEPVTEPASEPALTGHSARVRRREQGVGAGSREQGAGGRAVEVARPDVDRICAHLAEQIEGNGSKRPAVTPRWRESARLLLDRDGRTEEQVHAAITWCQGDEFWRANILSMPKLREKYDQLRLAAHRPAANGHSPTDQVLVRELARSQAVEADR